MPGRPGTARGWDARVARPTSTSASRWNRAVLGYSPVRAATSRTPTGEPVARSRSSTSARLRPSAGPASGASSAFTSTGIVYINPASRNKAWRQKTVHTARPGLGIGLLGHQRMRPTQRRTRPARGGPPPGVLPTVTAARLPARGERGDQGRVAAHGAQLRGTGGGAARLIAAGQRLGEEPRVLPGVALPLVREIVFVVDRLHRAHRLARPAVHALIRVDVKHPLTLVDAIHRALLHARPVQHVHARLADHVSHPVPFPGGMLLLEF